MRRVEINGVGIRRPAFVEGVDDKHLQDAENITPVIRSEKVNDEVRDVLDAVSAELSSDVMTGLVGRVVIDGEDASTVARRFLIANDLL